MDQSSQKDVHCSRLRLPKNTSSGSSHPPPSPSCLSVDETENLGAGVSHEHPNTSTVDARSRTATPPSALRCSQSNAEGPNCFSTTTTTTSQSVLITRGPTRPKGILTNKIISNKQCQSEEDGASGSTETTVDVSEMIQGRAREMFELRRLNDRLSSFIERVRILEAQNRTSAKEAATLRSNYTADISRMREVYTADVEHLRSELTTAEGAKTEAEVRLRRTEANLAELQKDRDEQDRSSGGDQNKVNQLNDRLLETDRELQVFRQRCIILTEERTRDRDVNVKLTESLKEANAEVDRLSLLHHASMNEVKSLREELCHHKKVHEAEMQEFSTLMQRESTQETVSIFRTEIMQVLREIQVEYEQRLEAAKTDIQAAFEMKTQMLKKVHASDGKERDQYREENSKLRALVMEQRKKLRALEEGNMFLERTLRDLQNDNSDRLRSGDRTQQHLTLDLNNCQMELQRLRLDFEALLDSKLGLEMEIASYRRLLECEEKRHGGQERSSDKVKSELILSDDPQKVSHARSSKGNVTIMECALDGAYILLTNNGSQREDIGDMKLVRAVDGDQATAVYVIPPGTVLGTEGSSRSIKVWSHRKKPTDSSDLELVDCCWPMGPIVRTKLLSSTGEERSSYILRFMPPTTSSDSACEPNK